MTIDGDGGGMVADSDGGHGGYDDREVLLLRLAVEAFGEAAILRDGVEVRWYAGEPALVDTASGHSMSLGRDSRLYLRMVHGATVAYATVGEQGQVVPLIEAPLSDPRAN